MKILNHIFPIHIINMMNTTISITNKIVEIIFNILFLVTTPNINNIINIIKINNNLLVKGIIKPPI